MHLHCTCKGIYHVEEYSVEVIIFQGTLISPFLFLTMHGSLKAPVCSCKSQQFPLSRWNNLYRKTFWFGMAKTFFSVEIKNLICVNSSNESWFLLFFFFPVFPCNGNLPVFYWFTMKICRCYSNNEISLAFLCFMQTIACKLKVWLDILSKTWDKFKSLLKPNSKYLSEIFGPVICSCEASVQNDSKMLKGMWLCLK